MGDSSRDSPQLGDRLALAERALVAEYLHNKGLDQQGLRALPEERQREILREAERYAFARLEELESEAGFVEELHDVGRITGHRGPGG